MKHTPGPWIYDPKNNSYINSPYMIWTSKGPGHGTVAETNSVGLNPTDPDMQAADACLIAAAPDLLEMCKKVLMVLTGPYSTSEGAWDDLEQVIKKAEGGDN